MHTTVKALFFLFAVIGTLSFSYSQSGNSAVVWNASITSAAGITDSVAAPDSAGIYPVNKDSVAAMDSLSLMEKKFDLFKYGDVISLANKLLLKKAPWTKTDIIEIYKLKAISHYSLSEDDAARKSFIEILHIDTSYILDSTKISPKIISFYRQVKQDYLQQQKDIEAKTVVRIDTVYIPKIEYDVEHENNLKNAIARSLIIPGLGQLYLDANFKSVALTILGTASLASTVFYFIRTEQKEKAYLVETDPVMIESRYSEYNNSFTKRNASLIAFGVLWLYSQLDLLFLSDNETGQSLNPSLQYENSRGLTLNLTYSF